MHFKQCITCVFVGIIISPVFAADLEDLAKVNCPQAYADYSASCQTKFENDLKQCKDDETQAKLKLRQESAQNRTLFSFDADESCQTLSMCDSDGDSYGDDDSEERDMSSIYNCFTFEGSKAAMAMSNLNFQAKALQTIYDVQLNTIQNNTIACNNKCSKDLSINTNKGMVELQSCLKSGKFELTPFVFDD